MFRSAEYHALWQSLRDKIKVEVIKLLNCDHFGYSAEGLAAALFWKVKPQLVRPDTALHNELTICVIEILTELNKEGRLLIHNIGMDMNREHSEVHFKLKAA